jgi:hypothetical protein
VWFDPKKDDMEEMLAELRWGKRRARKAQRQMLRCSDATGLPYLVVGAEYELVRREEDMVCILVGGKQQEVFADRF